MRSRLFFLNLIFILLTAAVTLRLFSLQVLSHEDFQQAAEHQHELYKILVPQRGEIFLRGKTDELIPVATNIEKDLVYAVPPEIEDKAALAASLAPLLELSKKEILEKISQDERKWVALKKQLPESVALKVKSLELPGIYLVPETLRFYPEQTFAAQVLGFFGFDQDRRVGRYGIEEYFEKELRGEPGSLFQIIGNKRKIQEAVHGQDLVLTLDRAIQFKAEEVLEQAVSKHQAEAGSLLVLNPKTGAILAMANYPGFNANEFNKVEDQAVFKNRAVSEAYEPGSVFKPVTMASGLETGILTADLTYEDKGLVVIGEHTIRNSDNKTYGTRTMTEVLEQSINTGAIFAQQQVGREIFFKTVKKFGFGKATGITLPAEAAGSIGNLEKGGDIHYATASFGQGLTATVLQLGQAFAAIANQGKMMKPYLVEGPSPLNKGEGEQVISSRTANVLSAMLVSVVEKGHGRRAQVSGYFVAGKTGTAQVARTDQRGYDPDRSIGTFAGFAPVNDPKFVMVVRIDNPQGVRFAESTAAPAFGEMARFLLNYYQVPPTR